MLEVHVGSLVGTWVAILFSLASMATAEVVPGPFDETIKRALALLPRQPEKVLVVDDTQAPRAFDTERRRVEAFVRHGEAVVYLIAQGDTLQRAQKGRGIFDFALATIIWHEMAHIAGADEPSAQRQEEALWQEYVRDGRVDASRGLKYLELLQARR